MAMLGKDHDKVFKIAVLLNSELLAEGEGKSKQEAETIAATHALNVIKNRIEV